MTFGLLTQMEARRQRIETSLKTRGFTATLIVMGIIILGSGILFSAVMGLAFFNEQQATSPSTTTTSDNVVTTICASVSGFFGLIGVIMILIAFLRRAKFTRDIEAAEIEYQKSQLQVITILEERYSPRSISSQSNT